jgi:hypothetical protein
MEMFQGNSLCSYLSKQKYHFFLFYKIREQEGRTDPVGELVAVGREEVEKGNGRVNMVQILCTHVYKC